MQPGRWPAARETKPRSQIGNFPAQLRDLSALVDELDGDAAQREPESFSADLGADSRQARLVVRGHARCCSRAGPSAIQVG
jgi:hypothetical protein